MDLPNSVKNLLNEAYDNNVITDRDELRDLACLFLEECEEHSEDYALHNLKVSIEDRF